MGQGGEEALNKERVGRELIQLSRGTRYLSCGASHHHLGRVFAEHDLLDSQPGVVAVGVKAANLDGAGAFGEGRTVETGAAF